MLSLKDRRRSPISIAAEIEEVGGQPVSVQTIRHTLHQIGVHGCHPRGEASSEDDTQESLQTVCWRHVNKAHGLLEPCPMVLMRWRLICLVLMASSMCGGDQERSTKISVSYLQSSMVMGMSWSKAAWVLQVLESYISLREAWTPTCTVKYCRRAWSPPSRNWVAGQCSSMTRTLNTPRRWPLLYWRGWGVKVMDWPSMSPDSNPIETLFGGSSSERWRCAKSQISASSATSSWRSGRAFSGYLWSSGKSSCSGE